MIQVMLRAGEITAAKTKGNTSRLQQAGIGSYLQKKDSLRRRFQFSDTMTARPPDPAQPR